MGVIPPEDGVGANVNVTNEVEVKNDSGNPIPVTGTIGVTEPVSVDDNGGSLTVDDGGSSLTVDGPLTDAELRATPVPVSGTVSVNEPVSVDDNGGSLTVDGPLTDAELRATPVPVSGTVSVNEPVSIDDNGGSITVDGSVSVSNFPATQNVDIVASTEIEVKNDAGNPLTVSGTVTANAGTGPFSVDDNGGSLTVDGSVGVNNFPATQTVNDGGLTLSVDDGGASITVDGSVTSNIGTTGGLALDATLTNASQKTKIVDSAGVNEASVSAAGAVKVDGSAVTQPVSGSVTANAGTNLNTSALALESGGNLAAAAASLSVIDDWDDGDRAKVSPISGQAGVQGGSGGVSALTQRVVLATDVALPAGTNNIGQVSLAPQTSNGLSVYRDLNLQNTGQNIKSSAGQVYGWYLSNTGSSTAYVKIYNTSGAPTSGDTPVMTIPVPAGSASNVAFPNGIALGTGIGIRAVTGVADANTTSPTANDVVGNIFYK